MLQTPARPSIQRARLKAFAEIHTKTATMPASTLQSMAQRACIRSLPGITDVADIPYQIIRSVLRKVQNPEQLREIEQSSPQIAEADAELWRAFIGRDIQGWDLLKTEPKDDETWEKVYEKLSATFNKQDVIIPPEESRTWAKLYTKLVKREERMKAQQEEELRAAMSGLTKQREENKANIISTLVPMKAKERGFVDGVPNPRASGWGVVKTPALQNAKRGKDVMAALKTQTRNAVKARTSDYGKRQGFSTAKPMPSAKQQIKSAPDWMVREQMKPVVVPAPAVPRTGPAAGSRAAPKVFTSGARKPPTASERVLDAGIRQSNAEREARLRALTQPRAKATGATSPPAQPARPAPRAVSPPLAGGRARPVPRVASPDSPETGVSRLGVNGTPPRRPSPVPASQQLLKKRPAPSLFTPQKKRKV